jgi:hypothetical protein
MFAAVRSFFTQPTSTRQGYAPISADEAAPPPPAPASPVLRSRDGKDVFICFWALGAGGMLSWNGELTLYAQADIQH